MLNNILNSMGKMKTCVLLLLCVAFCKGLNKPEMKCISGSISKYVGGMAMTEKGRLCQRWDTQSPHPHSFGNADSSFPDGSVSEANNYCRNPNGRSRLWCYTTDPDVEWEYCNVPECNDCKVSQMGREYSGTRATTRSGKTCQQWDSQSPRAHGYTSAMAFPDASVSDARNFCRNPDGKEDGPWCFTMDGAQQWEYCDIPACPKTGFALPKTPRAKHVVLIGVDGFRPDCSFSWLGNSASITKMKNKGTYAVKNAYTTNISLSAPAWSTILCGQSPDNSGIKTNKWKPGWMGFPVEKHPASGSKWPIPCLFETLKAQDKYLKTAAFYDWDWFDYLLNKGIPGSIDTEEYCFPLFNKIYYHCDMMVSINAAKYIRKLPKTAEKSFTYVYLGNLDTIGHLTTFCSWFYLQALNQADNDVGRVMKAIEDSGAPDDFLVVMVSDHGGFGFRHDENHIENKRTPLIFSGPGIKHQEFPQDVHVRDIPPTIADALGMQRNAWWTGRTLTEIYEEQ